MIRVLLHDDEVLVREAFKTVLEACEDITVVASEQRVPATLELCERGLVDVIVVVVHTHGANVLEIIRELRDKAPHVRVIALNSTLRSGYAARLIDAGCAGYLTKMQDPEDLITAIRSVADGGRFVSAPIAVRIALDRTAGHGSSTLEQLSDREFSVLVELARGRPVKEIAARLSLSPKTVSTYRSRLLEKLQLSSNADLVRYALDHRLLDDGESTESP